MDDEEAVSIPGITRARVTVALQGEAVNNRISALTASESKGGAAVARTAINDCSGNNTGIIRIFAGDGNCFTHKIITTTVSTDRDNDVVPVVVGD